MAYHVDIDFDKHPRIKICFAGFFVFIVWGLVIGGYRFIMSLWDLENQVWEMPFLVYTSIISIISVGTTATILIKSIRGKGTKKKSEKVPKSKFKKLDSFSPQKRLKQRRGDKSKNNKSIRRARGRI